MHRYKAGLTIVADNAQTLSPCVPSSPAHAPAAPPAPTLLTDGYTTSTYASSSCHQLILLIEHDRSVKGAISIHNVTTPLIT